jgi:hypothetical protein
MLAAGIVGLAVPSTAHSVAALADPSTACSLIGAGLALDLGSAWAIVTRLRDRH